MNDTEYISYVSTSETTLFDNQSSENSTSATELVYVTEFTEVSETTTVPTIYYDIKHIQHNTDGIFLMTCGIFFLLVIAGISKVVGSFLSM